LLDDSRACWRSDAGWDAAPGGAGGLGYRGVRDDLRDYVIDHLGDPGAVLVVDETVM
jgi:hypothetical protein